MAEGLTVEGMENGVTCTVGRGCTTVCLSTFAVFERLASESSLIDLSLLRPRERDSIVLELKVITCSTPEIVRNRTETDTSITV